MSSSTPASASEAVACPRTFAALAHRAGELNVPQLTELIAAVEHINSTQREEVTRLTISTLGGDATGKRVAVLGATFKPGTDDTRNSPSLTVAAALAAAGPEVSMYDPQAHVDLSGVTQHQSVLEALADADIVLHLTEWPEFRQLDPLALDGVVRSKVLIDGRLKLHRPTWQRAGWKVIQLGRASTW